MVSFDEALSFVRTASFDERMRLRDAIVKVNREEYEDTIGAIMRGDLD